MQRIDASGTWHNPNPAGANGYPALGEAAHAGRISLRTFSKLAPSFRCRPPPFLVQEIYRTLVDLVKLNEQAPGTRDWCCVATNLRTRSGGGEGRPRSRLGKTLPA
jgi:hypothetical protein